MAMNNATNTLETFRLARSDAFSWYRELSVAQKLVLALSMAALTGLAAQVRIPLPWTPVPITGQTLAVLMAGVFLGRWWGGISMALYVALGALGVPWFTAWSGGMGYLAGPTGGYVIGFVLAALFIGHFTESFIKARNLVSLFALMMAANFVLIYIPGLMQLGFWLNLVQGKTTAISQVLTLGLIPFIAGDVLKITAATLLARGIMPRESSKKAR
jgi:biotin transport system substrate-specific component